MRNILSFFIIGIFLPIIGISQIDTTKAKGTDSVKTAADTAKVIIVDTTVKVAATVVSNCYKDWYDFMRTRGAKPVTDGTHEAVVAFKTGES